MFNTRGRSLRVQLVLETADSSSDPAKLMCGYGPLGTTWDMGALLIGSNAILNESLRGPVRAVGHLHR